MQKYVPLLMITAMCSARNLSTSDLCVVSGSLKAMNESSLIDFDDLRDKEDQAKVGDQIVTSNISDMFLEGIPIGYITDIKTHSQQSDKIRTYCDNCGF